MLSTPALNSVGLDVCVGEEEVQLQSGSSDANVEVNNSTCDLKLEQKRDGQEFGLSSDIMHSPSDMKVLRKKKTSSISKPSRFDRVKLDISGWKCKPVSCIDLLPTLPVTRMPVHAAEDDNLPVITATKQMPRENYLQLKVWNLFVSTATDQWNVLLDTSKVDIVLLHTTEHIPVDSLHVVRVDKLGMVISRFCIEHWFLENNVISTYINPSACICKCDNCYIPNSTQDKKRLDKEEIRQMEAMLNTVFFYGIFCLQDSSSLCSTLVRDCKYILQRNSVANIYISGYAPNPKDQKKMDCLLSGKSSILTIIPSEEHHSCRNLFTIVPTTHYTNILKSQCNVFTQQNNNIEAWKILLEHPTPALTESDIHTNQIFDVHTQSASLYDAAVLQQALQESFTNTRIQHTIFTLGHPEIKLEVRDKNPSKQTGEIIWEPRKRKIPVLLPTKPHTNE